MQSAKLSFVGDIMSHIPQNKACMTQKGYSYARVFEQSKECLAKCGYLVGNLETPVAGKELLYSYERYSFNTPVQFVEELVSLGFNLVSTANNHCMDRGIQGLYNTIDTLDYLELCHIGTYKDANSRDKCFIQNINGIKVAFIAYTYGTNAFANKDFLKEHEQFAVNLTQPQETLPGSIHLLNSFDKIEEQVLQLYDEKNDFFNNYIKKYLEQIRQDIENCRLEGAEYIVFILHSGGQYNKVPDPYTLKLTELIRSMGVDAIVGHHPHVIHECKVIQGCPVAYSLGNFTFTPDLSKKGKDEIYEAEYSVLLNLYIVKQDNTVKTDKITFSVYKSVIGQDGISRVVPLYDLINSCKNKKEQELLCRDNTYYVNKFRGENKEVTLQDEYEFII